MGWGGEPSGLAGAASIEPGSRSQHRCARPALCRLPTHLPLSARLPSHAPLLLPSALRPALCLCPTLCRSFDEHFAGLATGSRV